jgi:hypothetical protein
MRFKMNKDGEVVAATRATLPTLQSAIDEAYAEYQRASSKLWNLLSPTPAEIESARDEWQRTVAMDEDAGPTDQEVATLIYENRQRALQHARPAIS